MKKVILVKRSDGSLVPAFQQDRDIVNKLKPGEHMFKFGSQRNPRAHALLFALAKCCLDNMPEKHSFWCDLYASNKNDSPYLFIKVLQLDCGMWHPVQHADGTITRVPDSIAWESKSEEQMQPIMDLLTAQCAKFIEVTYDEMRKNYIQYL